MILGMLLSAGLLLVVGSCEKSVESYFCIILVLDIFTIRVMQKSILSVTRSQKDTKLLTPLPVSIQRDF